MPCCGSKEFIQGPTAGASMNIECCGCQQRWNVAIMGGQFIIADKI